MLRIVVAVLLAVAVFVAGFALWRSGATPVSSPDAMPSRAEARAVEIEASSREVVGRGAAPESTAATLAAHSRVTPFVLPPEDRPLRESFAALDREARSGNAEAACRLGSDIARCRRWSPLRETVSDQGAGLAKTLNKEQVDLQIELMAVMQERAERLRVLCEGFDPLAVPPSARYFELAAARGHVPSALALLGGEPLHSDELFRDPDLIPSFRSHVRDYFMLAVAAGNLEALAVWQQTVLFRQQHPLYAALPPEWREPGFVAALSVRADPQGKYLHVPRALAAPSPEQQARAEIVFERYFADAVAAQATTDPAQRRRAFSGWRSVEDDTCTRGGPTP